MAAKNNDNNDNKDTLENNNDAWDGEIQTEDEMEAEIAYLAANADRHPSKRRRNKANKSKSDLKSEAKSDSESSKSKSSSNKNKPNASSDDKHSNGSNEKSDTDTDNKSDDTTDKKKITTTSNSKKKTSKARMLKKSDTRAIIAVIASSIVIIIAVIACAVGYVVTNANKTTTGSSGITTVASSGLPADPTKSATEWLEKYFDEVSDKFPADTFTEGNGNLEKLMNGDDSIIPDSMKKKIINGTNQTGMIIDRNTLNSVSYVGLIMFANAYEKTKAAGTQLSGSALTSFDSNNGIAFIPVQAIVVSDQNIIFELKWNSSTSDWQLIGDSLGWQTYIMIKNQELASSNSSSSSSSNNSNNSSK